MTHLNDLVAGLTRIQSRRITIGYRGYTVKAPCLLAQLAEAIEYRDDRNGTRTIPGSRPPLDMTALDLWSEVSYNLHTWARHLDINRQPYIAKPSDSQGLTLPPLGGLLRAVSRAAQDRAQDGILDALTRSCRSWTDRINGLFAPDTMQRQLYGIACWECDAKTVWTPRDGENVLTAAIVLNRIPSEGRSELSCQSCGWSRDLPSYDTTDTLEPV